MGKTLSKPLAERHGRGTAVERHGMCESAFKQAIISDKISKQHISIFCIFQNEALHMKPSHQHDSLQHISNTHFTRYNRRYSIAPRVAVFLSQYKPQFATSTSGSPTAMLKSALNTKESDDVR
jgi:hypothetical protein